MIFGIVCKEDNNEALALSKRVMEWMGDRGLACLIEDHIADFAGHARTENVWDNSSLLVVIGGDGTLLRAIRMSAQQEVPILGVHMGYLGFLTEVTENEVYDALESVVRGNYIQEERTMFNATIVRDGKKISSQHVLNDVVINKSALARIIDIEVWTNSTFITCYRADGLIVSTPTGSTAYNLATGGPIVHPQVDAIILTPICPHVLSNRSIVLPDFQEVVIIVNSGKTSDDIYLTLDGQRGFPLKAGDKLVVKRGELKAIMLRFPYRDYFEILRTKLGWQER
ncbi:MAG TPA: NAD(+)/NADH kinase [Deltaproteobacteria bacterium]|nr:NAD(+)/NADH kinase [Deltaproteobacteria bacterium]HPR51238.1 NAD(+)/NADH kinase [Deltaproteobacteria bacterium]